MGDELIGWEKDGIRISIARKTHCHWVDCCNNLYRALPWLVQMTDNWPDTNKAPDPVALPVRVVSILASRRAFSANTVSQQLPICMPPKVLVFVDA